MNNSNFKNWNKKWFGFFSPDRDEHNSLPYILDYVDEEWAPDDKDQIINYLNKAKAVLTSASIPTECMLCIEYKGDPGEYHSDGLWLWPGRLSHYVEAHAVRLPESFVEHIRKNKYQPTDVVDIEISDLPWPDLSN